MDPKAIHERLVGRLGDKVLAATLDGPGPFAVVVTDAIAEAAAFLKSEPDLLFDNLMCLSAVDYPKEKEPRMEVVYHLFSYQHRHSFVVKVHVPRQDAVVPTVEEVWRAATFHEREAFDLFGIRFAGHSDLRRILLPDDWEGHPLRKDWQDPELYNGMHVKPTPQMAERALAGEAIGVGPFDFTPPNRHVE
jgi:NADH-quinone oxidoreductase subunit C